MAVYAKGYGIAVCLVHYQHHNGFYLWDSQFTDYDGAASPVKIDIVKAVSDACKPTV
ncbi:alpha-L-fucosidase [Sphingobacterium sp. HMA12]|uniref:alpha-L-fucosidase n=1 Tax=Sphingobacterium sp. HMA12 TaxID=2050894 RepID=UPI0018F822BA|nr:alpha-L-fucosidase [Sphingobacterium sp. HMA12]